MFGRSDLVVVRRQVLPSTGVEGPCMFDSTKLTRHRELARSNSLAAGEELVTVSKVPSDLLQLEIRTLLELGLLFSTSTSPRCKWIVLQ